MAKSGIEVKIDEILHHPGETHYEMTAEIPNQDPVEATVVRDINGVVKMHKESQVHPYVAQKMIAAVKEHFAQVHLD